MICSKCKTDNDIKAKFCLKCGNHLKNDVLGSVDTYFAKQTKGCQICGSLTSTKQVEFYGNIGMLFARRNYSIKGKLCKKCINREFLNKTLMTLFLGWWGTISFIITPFYLINNVVRFIPTLGMKQEDR